MALQYDPLTNNFVTYESAPTPKVELKMPLIENPVDITDWASHINERGTPIVSSNLPTATRSNPVYRVPDITSENKSDSEDLSSLSFEDLVKQENLPVKITSGFRKGAKTKSGHASYHSQTDSSGKSKAYDIVPTNGNFEELLNTMYSNPRVVSWFRQRGYGILEETSSDIMRKTGATGRHLHIGPDKSALDMFNKRISKAQEGMKLTPFVEYESVETPKVELNLPLIDNSIDISDWSKGFTSSGIPIVKDNLPMATRSKQTYYMSNPTEGAEETSISTKATGFKKQAMDYFINKGLAKHHAQGIVANLLGESELNSKAVNPTSKAYGIAQWLGNRKKRLFNKYGNNPTFEQQLDFLWDELQTTENSAFQALLQTKNAHEATNSFMKRFERPSSREMAQSIDKRLKFADSLA